MLHSRVGTGRQRLTAGLTLSAMVLAALSQGSASAQVSEVIGSAFGYQAAARLGALPVEEFGPEPHVILPPAGGSETATAPSAQVVVGPATLFTSGPLEVTTEGTTGPTGGVTSTARIQTVNTSGQEVFTADEVSSTCTATEDGVTGSTTITGGTLRTSEGDPTVEGDEVVVTIPTNPAPNTTYEGQIETVGDSFRYVFNEQVENDDGSITVYAAHLYLLGPIATGDLLIGKSTCGVNPAQVTTTTTEATTTTTAGPTTTTTTVGGRPQAPAAVATAAQPRFTG